MSRRGASRVRDERAGGRRARVRCPLGCGEEYAAAGKRDARMWARRHLDHFHGGELA